MLPTYWQDYQTYIRSHFAPLSMNFYPSFDSLA